ncbi:MAG: single-stranded DNA-binding protein [Minisyncoccia bacterium]
MYLNKVYLIGNLTRDPELKSLPTGNKVCSFGVATNRVWKDANGAKQESAEYHNVVVFGRQAETSAQYLKKGQQVMIEGRIQTRSWDDKTTNEKKYRTEIIAESVQFGAKTGGGPSDTGEVKGQTMTNDGKLETINYGDEEVNINDIPF